MARETRPTNLLTAYGLLLFKLTFKHMVGSALSASRNILFLGPEIRNEAALRSE
jgi:hypothetical protein